MPSAFASCIAACRSRAPTPPPAPCPSTSAARAPSTACRCTRAGPCGVPRSMRGSMARMDEPVRVDKWLWAARLLKTRALAAEAVKGGRVHVNGRAIKPSKDIRPGDELELTARDWRITVVVRGTAERRGPAKEAQLLYEEPPDSREERERRAAERRLAAPPVAERGGGRPTKRDRRRLDRQRGR